MTIVFDEIDASIEQPRTTPEPAQPGPAPDAQHTPKIPLERQLRLVYERQARLCAD